MGAGFLEASPFVAERTPLRRGPVGPRRIFLLHPPGNDILASRRDHPLGFIIDQKRNILLRKRWHVMPPWPAEQVENIARRMDILPVTAAILLNRGLREEKATRSYLNPASVRLLDYRVLPGTQEAGAFLAEAIRRKTLIAVAGDYDVDGITASSLLAEFIRDSGGRCRVFLPDRQADGYGLNANIVREAAALGAGLLITVDCGITALEEVTQARRSGLTVIVTDHHEPGSQLPDADALVNPKVSGPEEMRLLAGVGVALQVVRAAADALGWNDKRQLMKYLDLVALGTVADVVPLLGENRILVYSGLKIINQSERLGLKALLKTAGLEQRRVTSGDLAFKLAPRLNAAGRLGDAGKSLRLLLSGDPAEAESLADLLNQENARRQALEQAVIREVLARIENQPNLPLAIVASGADWPVGVLGLAASKVCERFHRPCFVMSENQGIARGSGRSIPGFALHEALAEMAPLLDKWGGHEMAAGVTLGAARLAEFDEALNRRAEARLQAEQLVPVLDVDVATSLDSITQRLIRELSRLEPYGFGNAKPVMAISGLRLALPPRVVGERHLKLKVTDGRHCTLDVIGFGLAERAGELKRTGIYDLAGHISENEWNGSVNLQMEMKDIREAE